jgi:hypothetical protein
VGDLDIAGDLYVGAVPAGVLQLGLGEAAFARVEGGGRFGEVREFPALGE